MKTIVTMKLWVEVDGDDYHVHDDTQTHGNGWGEVYRGMIMLRDELNRQISEAKSCPFNPANIKRYGKPEFD